MSPFHERAHQALPRLTANNYRPTNPATWTYNCIAWAVGVTNAWWWPMPGRFWPEGVPREETIPAFFAALATVGFVPGTTADLEPDLEKVALFAIDSTPTHAARQLSNGWWSSKLGPAIDIEHSTLDAVAGGTYGEVVAILSRKRSGDLS